MIHVYNLINEESYVIYHKLNNNSERLVTIIDNISTAEFFYEKLVNKYYKNDITEHHRIRLFDVNKNTDIKSYDSRIDKR